LELPFLLLPLRPKRLNVKGEKKVRRLCCSRSARMFGNRCHVFYC